MYKLFFNTVPHLLELHHKAYLDAHKSSINSTIPLSSVKAASLQGRISLDRLSRVNRGIIPDKSFANRRKRTVDVCDLMETCMSGQFIAETRAGRDAFSLTLIAYLERVKTRHGLDGLLLTVLSHLKQTGSQHIARAKKIWSATPSTAKNGQVAFDCRTNKIVALEAKAFDSARDPFGRGLERPAFEQAIAASKGGNVMDASCSQRFAAAGTYLGTVLGAAAGAVGGGLAGSTVGGGFGAVGGGFAGGISGGLAGGAAGQGIGTGMAPIWCGWVGEFADDSGPANTEGAISSSAKGTSDNPIPVEELDKEPPPENKETTDTGGDDDGPPPDDGGDYPNNEGYPAPDDGSGNPWSMIAISSVITISQARQMMKSVVGGGYSISAFDPIHTGANVLDQGKSLMQNMNDVLIGKSKLLAVGAKTLAASVQVGGISVKKVITQAKR